MAVATAVINNLAKEHVAKIARSNGHICPPLIAGDRLTRAEFERRYEATPEHVKAELIGGVVYMPSPVTLPHGQSTANLALWLGYYAASTPSVECIDNTTVRLDTDSEPQPDMALRLVAGGTSRPSEPKQTPRGPVIYLEGAPELVAEVAFSSALTDLKKKPPVYARNGVKEYLVWLLVERKLIWFRLQDGKYVRIKPDRRGVIESAVFPGLRLKVKALLAGRMVEVLDELQLGLASPAHAAFVAQLPQKSRPKATNKK